MELTKRSMDEMIANFNREVSCMDLFVADKIKILGMITAIGFRYKEDVQFVHAIPTAQPERTCVNCGRTANNGGWYADGGTRCPIEEHYALPKDGYCHLWEKRNVTDDDYPERRTDGSDRQTGGD